MSGLLIVNADDFGGNRLATDRIAQCFAHGAITSASAMVYMSDSDRAAQIGRERGLPLGLHLNLTQPFEDPATPAEVRARQQRALAHFAESRLARLTLNPRLVGLVRRCVADQLERFKELYGREPTHIDGHNHVHLSPTVLLVLPRDYPTRTAESRPHERVGAGALLRRARHALIAHRHPTTERFFPIDLLGAAPSRTDIEALVCQADKHRVEIMTHPDRDSDHRLLMSADWQRALHGRRLGSFAELADETRRAGGAKARVPSGC